ncbi:MAG: HD-GYP domain-containing protein [Treponema sp.]|jgi:HD-GYP domain-containing protein (c-di-GMP phosphodiesterase class II)|nr:HD-GYP domain-containing protein [Treponema sp.]
MNSIDASTLKPGLIFSAPVYTEGEYLLVPAMVPLRQKDIDILVSCNIDAVRTEGTTIEAEEVLRKEALLKEEALKKEILVKEENIPQSKKAVVEFSIDDVKQNTGPYRTYRSLIEKVNTLFSIIKSGVDIDMKAVDVISDNLLQNLLKYPDNFIDYILGGEVTGHELAKSSVNTAILAALTAHELELPNHKIHNIVAGALLHDVGMLRLSKGITEKKGGLSDAELEQIKSHPLHTSKIVTKELFGPHEVNLIALQHHERWDGHGYPDHIVGPAIDIGARIVSVADAFEAMVSKKSYRDSMVGYQAIRNLLADNARRFDPAVIIAFTKIMGIYPIGSIVKLNNGSVARVVSVHADAPLRPVVQMLIDEKGNVPDSGNAMTIDLLIEKTLFIKTAIDPNEFAGENE